MSEAYILGSRVMDIGLAFVLLDCVEGLVLEQQVVLVIWLGHFVAFPFLIDFSLVFQFLVNEVVFLVL